MTLDNNIIKQKLQEAGIEIDSIYDLVNTAKSYPKAIPILLCSLKEGIEDNRTREGVIRALAVKEAKGKATAILIEEYYKTRNDMSLRWAIGNTVYMTVTENDVDDILAIIQNKKNGISRQMFVAALGKIKSKKAEDVLISLLDDSEVAAHAIEALARMQSKFAKDKIEQLVNHPNQLIKKEAKKALKKMI